MLHIVIPQAIKNVIPAIGNELIALLKETSIVSMVGIIDLTFSARIIGSGSEMATYLAPMIVAALFYLAVVYLLVLIIRIIEKKFKQSEQHIDEKRWKSAVFAWRSGSVQSMRATKRPWRGRRYDMGDTGDIMIDVKDLHKSFGHNTVLNGVDISIRRGEKIAVIGPSGSGKSTFLRCLNLLEQPTAGIICFEGDEIFSAPFAGEGERQKRPRPIPSRKLNAYRQQMGMVFQHFNLFNNLTVLENIMFAPVKLGKQKLRRERRLRLFSRGGEVPAGAVSSVAQIEKEAKDRALALLERIGLADKASAYPSTLSGGQRQRIAIVRGARDEPEGDALRRTDIRARPRNGRRGIGAHQGTCKRGHDNGHRHARNGICARGRYPRSVYGRRKNTGARHARTYLRRADE